MYKYAIFDLDGTVLNTLNDLANSVNYALTNNNLPNRSLSEVKSFVGNGIRRLIDLSVPKNTSKEVTDRVFADFCLYYEAHCNDLTAPYEDIIPTLKKLKSQGIKLALVSNKADFAVKKLSSIYFDDIFDYSLGALDDTPKKPAKNMVYKAIAALINSSDESTFSPELLKKCVYIGDSDVDIATAINSGIDCISVTWGFRDIDFLKENGATQFADSCVTLYKIILK